MSKKKNKSANLLIINRGGQNYQIVEPLNITEDGCAYCIKADYYKMGYANFMNHAKDGFKATGIKVTDMENEDIKPKVVGKLKYDSDFNCGAKIYDTDGIAPTQQTITGGNLETKIIEYRYKEQTIISKPHGYFKGSETKDISPCVKSSAMAENNFVKETITDMSKKENIEQKEPTIGAIRTRSYKGQPQTLEHNGSTISNAITSVQKDSVVVEPINTTEDGLATTLTTAHHYSGNIVNPKRGQTEMGVIEYKTTEPLNPYNDGTSRTIKGQYQCTSTVNLTRGDSLGAIGAVTFDCKEENNNIQNYRIRKLTPREVFRLMDVSEPDIDTLLNAGISNSQLYKLAGNSICCGVLYHIFRKMFIETDMDNTGKPQQLNLF